MKTYKLHLIRHGLTQGNIDGLYVGHTDMSLCAQGREQILQMKREMTYPRTQFVFSSPLKRCLETSKLIYPELTPVVVNDLIECNFGVFDGKTAEELHEKQPLFDSWLTGAKDVEPPFGESNEAFAKRVCDCFVKIVDGIIKSKTDDVVIITHGGVISTILSNCALPEVSPAQWLTPSGCGFTVRITPEIWLMGRKLEVTDEIPYISSDNSNYYDGWDYYPNPDDDDFDISEYVNDYSPVEPDEH